MSFAALIPWLITAFGGLYLLVIWLIEYDVSAPGGAISRLPRTVITGHVLLATSGLIVWIIYLIEDRYILAWVALSTLFVVALLGLTMLGRWIVGGRGPAGGVGGRTRREPAGGRPPRPPKAFSPSRSSWAMAFSLVPRSPWYCSPSSEWAAADRPHRPGRSRPQLPVPRPTGPSCAG